MKFIRIILLLLLFAYPNYRYYEVKRGDTLYKIGKMFHLDFRQLIRLNNTKMIYAGQKIKLPNYALYRVKKGDTLTKIAQKFGVSVSELRTLNAIGRILYEGAVIKIPNKKQKAAGKSAIEKREKKGDARKKNKAINYELLRSYSFIWPVTGTISDRFGLNDNIMNYGVLFDVARNEKVISAEKGVVAYTGRLRGLGKIMLIAHTKNLYSIYGGLSTQKKKKGDTVKKGEVIGSVIQRREDLFFSIFRNGEPSDPLKFFQGR
ncbi:LysM peptidoglycan-binding domain-containing protein [Spirochaetota bacterium]